MSTTITLEEAQVHLAELVARLVPGEEVVIVQDKQPVAKLVGQREGRHQPRQPGSAKGKLLLLSEDEAHLKDFKKYIP
ncbi:MAG: antitoxin of toxin-antitoxin stability system [Candidatus Latescibacteria bacterium]|nr:antitoxin of toxin-antitoxin stability system [Candidatus Latescibacterota bacterium]